MMCLDLATVHKQKVSAPCSCRFQSDCLKVMLDSGAALHATGNADILINLHTGPTVTVVNAFGDSLSANQYGTLQIITDGSHKLNIEEVLLGPGVAGTLLSTSQLMRAGYSINFSNHRCLLTLPDASHISIPAKDKVFYIHATTVPQHRKLFGLSKAAAHTLTRHRFGHVSRCHVPIGAPC